MASTDTLDRLVAGTERLKFTDCPPTPPETDGYKFELSDEVAIPLPPPSTRPQIILDVDKNTPDNHVPRDPRLIRLTGVHPFNVEAPLTDLFREGESNGQSKYSRPRLTLIIGFLTSPELFYVRNHGAVPQVRDEEIANWEFSVEG